MKREEVLQLIDREEERLRREREKVEERMRLLDKHGVLFRRAIRRAHLEFIEQEVPWDFNQEKVAFFLSEDTQEPPSKEFLRGAQRHMYRMGVAYGFIKNNPTHPHEVPMSSLRGEDEPYDVAQERITGVNAPLNREEFEELTEEPDLLTREGRRRVRAMLAFRDGTWREKYTLFTWCGLCGQPLEFRGATIDHIVPRAQGGKDALDNLHLAHKICNESKGDRLPPLVIALEEAMKRLQMPGPDDPPRRIIVGKFISSKLSLKELQEKLGVSKSTAWRVRKQGYFWAGDYRHKGPRTGGGERVELTPAERKLPAYALMDRFGLSASVAQETGKRGWFEVNDKNRSYIHIPEDRNLNEEEIGRLELPDRIEIGPEGKRIAEMTSPEIADAFDLSMKAALQIRRRGFVSTRTWTREKKRQVAEILYEMSQTR